jgi:hypothetical protein
MANVWSAVLTDNQFQGYLSILPDEWASAKNAAYDAIDHLSKVRDRLNDCVCELQRALT